MDDDITKRHTGETQSGHAGCQDLGCEGRGGEGPKGQCGVKGKRGGRERGEGVRREGERRGSGRGSGRGGEMSTIVSA